MPEAKFNAYTQWLGIPPEELPPTHYRLLGVAASESNPQAIDVAARKLAALVKSKAVEPYVGAAKKILIELAAARTCLLDPDTRAEYDKSLPEVSASAKSRPSGGAPPKRAIPTRPNAQPPRRTSANAPIPSAIPSAIPAPIPAEIPAPIRSGAPPVLEAGNSLPFDDVDFIAAVPSSASSKIGSSGPRKPMVAAAATSQRKPAGGAAGTSANHASQPVLSRKEKAKRTNRMALFATGGMCLLGLIIVAVMLLRGGNSAPVAAVENKLKSSSAEKPKVADSSSKPATAGAKPTAATQKIAPLPAVTEETPSTLFEAIDANVSAADMTKLLDGPAAQFIDAQDRNRNNRTPLRMAVKRGRVDLVKLLIQHRANVNLGDEWGETPLMSAAQSGDLTMVAALLEAKASINAQTRIYIAGDGPDSQPEGITALALAASHGKTDVVKLLIEKGSPTVDLGNVEGVTPLMVAAWKGYPDVVKELLAAGANCNYADRRGETVLMFAVDGQNLPVVDLLLRAGAKTDVSARSGVSVKSMADDIGNAEIIKRLSEGNGPAS